MSIPPLINKGGLGGIMHGFFLTLSRVMAFLGGVMLSGLILLTGVSVLGRALNGALHSDGVQGAVPELAAWLLSLGIGPVQGDFELIEAGVAFSIFAFLPYCQITGGHAAVDIFTARWPARRDRWRQMLTDILFASVLILIAVQLGAGMFSKMRSGQTTFLLEFPLWWAYALSLSGAVVAAMVAGYIALARIAEVIKGRALLPAKDRAAP